MASIRLIRKLSGAKGNRPGALGVANTAPIQARPLGTEWWTRGWGQSTRAIDEPCEAFVDRLRHDFLAVEEGTDPMGQPFARLKLGEELPLELQQAALGIPDEFATTGTSVVLRKAPGASGPEVRVCDPEGEVIGIVEKDNLLRVEFWLEWAAYWLFACLGIGPDDLKRTLETRLP